MAEKKDEIEEKIRKAFGNVIVTSSLRKDPLLISGYNLAALQKEIQDQTKATLNSLKNTDFLKQASSVSAAAIQKAVQDQTSAALAGLKQESSLAAIQKEILDQTKFHFEENIHRILKELTESISKMTLASLLDKTKSS